MRLAPRLAEARHSDKEKTYCGFIARLTPRLSDWILISLGIIRLLISGSQVRALVRPPPGPLFWGFAETVEKGPLLAGFSISARADPGLRSRKCGNFDPWSLVPKLPFLARFPIVRGELCRALI